MVLRASIVVGTILAISVNFAEPVAAFGNDDYWVSGFGQGVCESVITKGPGNQIYVACDCGSLRPSTISFMLGGESATGDQITLTFDAEDPVDIWISDGVVTSDCRACAANFDYVISRFRAHNSVFVRFENGLSTRFSLRGANDAIGECASGFSR